MSQLLNQRIKDLQPDQANIMPAFIHLNVSSMSTLNELQVENCRLRDLNSELLEIEKELKDTKDELKDVNNRLKEVEKAREEREFMYFISDCVKEFHDGFFETEPKSQNQKQAFFRRLHKAQESVMDI
jgi:chromosome segregation ATPase